MKKAMTAIIACFFCMTCHAATEKRGDVVNFSLGKYGCTPNLDNSMVSANLAPSAMIDKSCINFQYNNSYFLPQIGFSDINLHLALKKLNIGFYFNHYGFSEYAEFSAGISFSKFFAPWFAFNLAGEYCGFYLSKEEGVASSGMAHLSFLAFPVKNLCIGLSLYNISFSKLKTAFQDMPMPSRFTLGISYDFTRKALLSCEFGKELRGPVYYAVGLEYMPVKQFVLRTGIGGEDDNVMPCGGFGLRLGIFGIDFGVKYHFKLGLSMAAGIKFSFKK